MMSDNKKVSDLMALIQSYYFQKDYYQLWIRLWKEKLEKSPDVVVEQISYLLGEKMSEISYSGEFGKWRDWSTQKVIPWLAELAEIALDADDEIYRLVELENTKYRKEMDSLILSTLSGKELRDRGMVRCHCSHILTMAYGGRYTCDADECPCSGCTREYESAFD